MIGFYGVAFKANMDLGLPDYYKPHKWLSS